MNSLASNRLSDCSEHTKKMLINQKNNNKLSSRNEQQCFEPCTQKEIVQRREQCET